MLARSRLLLLWLLCSANALAATELAADLRARAQAQRSAAAATYKQAQHQCARRFFVNACLHEANDIRLATLAQARTLEEQAAKAMLAQKVEQARERDLALPQTAIPAPTTIGTNSDSQAQALRAQQIRAQRHEQQQRAAKFARQMQQREQQWRTEQQQRKAQAAQQRAERARQKRQRYAERLQKHQLRQQETKPAPSDQP